MRTIKIIFGVLGAVALIFGLVYFGGLKLLPDSVKNSSSKTTGGSSVSNKIGSSASFFDLPDIKNNRIKLTDFNGTPTVIFFWSTWDSGGADQVKIFDDYVAQEASNGRSLVKIVGIDSQEDLSIASSFIRRGGYSIPIAVDTNGSVSEEYGVKAIPTIFFIDSSGVIREVWSGVLSVSQIVDKVEVILK
jgi:peroxiredoxin